MILREWNSILMEPNNILRERNSILRDQIIFWVNELTILRKQNSTMREQNNILREWNNCFEGTKCKYEGMNLRKWNKIFFLMSFNGSGYFCIYHRWKKFNRAKICQIYLLQNAYMWFSHLWSYCNQL